MSHSSVRPYPLPFPNEVQRTQLAPHSSLANALGTDSGKYTNRRRQAPRLACEVVTDAWNIYLNETPVSNPSYPYPARNFLNPGKNKLSSAPNRRSPRSSSITWDESGNQKDLSGCLSRYDRLPQPRLVEPDKPHEFQPGLELPAVRFVRRGNKGPYSVQDLLSMGTMPDLVAGDAPIFVQSPDRWIKIRLIWPGYSAYPFEKRIPIKQGAPLTPALLLMVLAYDIEKFVRWIHNEGAIVEPGQEHWAITGVTGDAPAMWKNCIIASLEHQTGSIWQPEIYHPRG